MDHRVPSRTGIRVSPLRLGTMNFGGPTPQAESIDIVQAALGAGINFIDSNNSMKGRVVTGAG